jgi:hypothetical protein
LRCGAVPVREEEEQREPTGADRRPEREKRDGMVVE